MHLDGFRTYCLQKPGATEGLPFGPDALVFKVAGKMFALAELAALPPRVALKCEPEHAVGLRERYAAVTPAYHFNKRHWINVAFDGEVPDDEVRALVDDAYALVVKGLTRRDRERLAAGED